MFKGSGLNQTYVPGIQVSTRLSPDTILYGWGNCSNGKLGISNNYYAELVEGDQHTQFYTSDRKDTEKTEQMIAEMEHKLGKSLKELEDIENLIEFEQKYMFTPHP